MGSLPNIRQEKFVQGLFEGKSAIDAGYRPDQGNSSRMKWYEMVQSRFPSFSTLLQNVRR